VDREALVAQGPEARAHVHRGLVRHVPAPVRLIAVLVRFVLGLGLIQSLSLDLAATPAAEIVR